MADIKAWSPKTCNLRLTAVKALQKDTRKNDTDQKSVAAGRQKRGKEKNTLSAEQMTSLQSELNRTWVAMETVQERYKIKEPGNMGEELYKKVMTALSKTKSSTAA